MQILKPFAIIVSTLLICSTYIWSIKFQQTPHPQNAITVQGYGEAQLVPDRLSLFINIQETGQSTEESQAKLESTLSGVQKILETEEITLQQIKTENLTTYPRYIRENSNQTITGYTSSLQLQIQLSGDNFQQKGSKILSLLPQAGNIIISDTQLSFSHPRNGSKIAREKAFADAQDQAQHLAQLAGENLGPVLAIQEQNTHYYPQRQYSTDISALTLEKADANSNLITPGEETQSQTLSVTFALQ